jgi:hypothetical protein
MILALIEVVLEELQFVDKMEPNVDVLPLCVYENCAPIHADVVLHSYSKIFSGVFQCGNMV